MDHFSFLVNNNGSRLKIDVTYTLFYFCDPTIPTNIFPLLVVYIDPFYKGKTQKERPNETKKRKTR